MGAIPKTAGQILSESRLRAFVKCSQFYSYGGETSHDVPVRILQETLEKIFAQAIRRELEPRELMAPATTQVIARISKEEGFTESQQEFYARQTILLMDEFFKLFPSDKYMIVSPPVPVRVVVSKTPIDLKISAILRSIRNQTLHLIDFSPYINERDIANDPVMVLKVTALKDIVKPHFSGRPTAQIHVFGLSNKGTLQYNTLTSNEALHGQINMVESVIRSMERGYHYPVTPCGFACPFKKQCKLGDL